MSAARDRRPHVRCDHALSNKQISDILVVFPSHFVLVGS